MPKRVAITIAGAVSLGSYEAGVTYELLEALRVHNENAIAESQKIYVDVITGASAGGMTAAMLAEWLMFFGDSMKDEATNPLYRAWVEKISLWRLVLLKRGEKKWGSLFSSNVVSSIGEEMLMDSMTAAPTGPHACMEKGATLRIGLALTNLNGINYMIPIEGSDEKGFNYTRSADQQLFNIQPDRTVGPLVVAADGTAGSATWGQLRDAAVGCGAFPFAFRPRGIPRSKTEFVNAVTPEWPGAGGQIVEGTTYVIWGQREPNSFAYTDGGVLQNQPLGIAKDLVDASVGERLAKAATLVESKAVEEVTKSAHQDADDRLYVFISPNEVKSSFEQLEADKIGLKRIGPEALRTYFRQAAFHDWIMAEKVNQSIRILDERAKELAAALQNGRIEDPNALLTASGNLNDLLLGDGWAGTLLRLQHQYADLYETLRQKDPRLAQAFVNGIATLESAARLADRDKMHIVAVLADGKTELAGSGICAFVGFFSRKFRDHDYLVGRTKARAYLQRDDVQKILQLDAGELKNYWEKKPLGDPQTLVKLPLSLSRMLFPGLGPLSWMVFLRVWVWLLVLVVYGIVAHHLRWWPF